MAPPAKSRKGKKAWRRNIDTSEVEAFLEEKTYQERRGPAAKELKDDQLFFVDTTADVEGAVAVAEGKRPAKRRREEAAAKPLRSELIIAEAHKAKPLALAPPTRKPSAAAAAGMAVAGKSNGALVPATAAGGGAAGATAAQKGKRRHGQGASAHPLDLWGDEDLVPDLDLGAKAEPGPGSAALLAAATAGRKRAGKKAGKAVDKAAAVEPELAVATAAVRAMGPSARALRRGKSPPADAAAAAARPAAAAAAQLRVKAVAVDVPGCSFNPDAEQHQDALALLVAAEMRKELRKELLPSAPPEEVEAPEGRPLSELEALQVEAADSDEEDEEEEDGRAGRAPAAAAAQDPNVIALVEEGGDEDGSDDGDGEEEGVDGAGKSGKNKKLEKKSRKDRNKEARRKAAEAEAAERRRLKAQRRELQSLGDVQAALEEEQREKEIRRLRRAAMLEERATTLPPRLGKLRFEPPSVQVLTSDEKTGSLRLVVPCAMLAADRFKSLQQRGLVEPRKPQPFKEKRRKVTYEKGARFEKAAEASAEVRELTHRNKKARRQGKAAAARAGGEDDWL